ncbi:MAG: GAF domain-containing protein [Candidatus Omnitrophica bacterium]|nr:GAF domain-containing protein [Candidatus Omnitrophota bacterium]
MRDLYELIRLVNSTHDLNRVLNIITRKVSNMVDAKVCSLRLLDRDKKELILRSYHGPYRRSHLSKGNLKMGESISGRAIKEKKAYIIADLYKDSLYKSPEIARHEGVRSLLTVPLLDRGKALGVLSVYSDKPNRYHMDDLHLLSIVASQVAVAISNARLFQEIESNYINTVKVLVNTIDAKDSYIYGHSEKVAIHSFAIARELDLSPEERQAVRTAGFLHDMGKISVDSAILRKKGFLNDDEWHEIEKHPEIGARIISQIPNLNHLAPLVLHHHARFGGGGYPDKNLKGADIPIGARIISVADAYEAMVSARPYRGALEHRIVVEELRSRSNSQFDPHIVHTFLKVLKKDQEPQEVSIV